MLSYLRFEHGWSTGDSAKVYDGAHPFTILYSGSMETGHLKTSSARQQAQRLGFLTMSEAMKA
jgi:hypothetical protein